MKYVINDNIYEVLIERKNNKNTYIRIKDNDVIYVTTNYLTTKSKVKKLLDSNLDSIIEMIDKKNREIEKSKRFYYLGKEYDLVKIPTFKDIVIEKKKIYYPDDKRLNKWLKREMLKLFFERLEINYNRFMEEIPFPKLKIRTMKTRWGVCNRKYNSITLNSKLIEYEIDKLDYVIIHELSHFVYFDHSKNFWGVVAKYCPNYKVIRRQLKD